MPKKSSELSQFTWLDYHRLRFITLVLHKSNKMIRDEIEAVRKETVAIELKTARLLGQLHYEIEAVRKETVAIELKTARLLGQLH